MLKNGFAKEFTNAQSSDAELVVAGTLLASGLEPLPKFIELVTAKPLDYFQEERLAGLVGVIRKIRSEGELVEEGYYLRRARKLGLIETTADEIWFSKLADAGVTLGYAEVYAKEVWEAYCHRENLAILERINSNLHDPAIVHSGLILAGRFCEQSKAELNHTTMSAAESINVTAIPGRLLRSQNVPVRRSIIGTFFREGDTGFLYARRGVGKTLFGFEIARLVTIGGRLRNWKSEGGHRVVYLDCEMPYDEMLKRAIGFDLDTREDFVLINHELLYHRANRVINMADRDQQDAMTAYLEKVGAKLFILDNLSTGISKQDENKALDWEIIGSWLLELRRRHIASLILHHAGRNNEMRGTSKREDAATWILRLDDDASHENPGEPAMTAMFTKFRSGTPDEAKPFSIRFVNKGEKIVSHTTNADTIKVVIQWVRDGLTSATEIAKEIGITQGAVSKLAARAIKLGRLSKKGREYFEPAFTY